LGQLVSSRRERQDETGRFYAALWSFDPGEFPFDHTAAGNEEPS